MCRVEERSELTAGHARGPSGAFAITPPIEPLRNKTPKTKKKVLIVEDVPLLALEVSDIVADAGYDVVGPATTVGEALTLISQVGGDVAVVDFRLGSETADDVASTLQSMGTPLIFLSCSSQDEIPEEFHMVPLLVKPVNSTALIEEIQHCVEGKARLENAVVAKYIQSIKRAKVASVRRRHRREHSCD